MRSGAERRGSSASAPPGSPPSGRARPAGPDAPLALQPPAAGQPRARDSGDARAQPRPLFAWSKWKKRMGSSVSAATARRPVFDDKEDGESGPTEGTLGRSREQHRDPIRCRKGVRGPLAVGFPRVRTPHPARWEGVLGRLGFRGNSQTVPAVPVRVQGARLYLLCPVTVCLWLHSSGLRPTPKAVCFHFLFRGSVRLGLLPCTCAVPTLREKTPRPTGGTGRPSLSVSRVTATWPPRAQALHSCGGDGLAFVQRPALGKLVCLQFLLQVKLPTQRTGVATQRWVLVESR